MTCIFGVVCKDGIVLVGDKKVTAGAGSGVGYMSFYQDKIKSVANYENLVVAAAGDVIVRDKFVNDINNLDILLKKKVLKEDPSRGFVGLVEDIAARLFKIYFQRIEDYSFEALICQKPKSGRPWLFMVDACGCATEITRKDVYCILGTGDTYGHLFIRPAYPERGDMEGVAIISTFIIHLINEMGIDNTIGPDENGNVQVWYFPNNADPYEVKGPELMKIVNEAKKEDEKIS